MTSSANNNAINPSVCPCRWREISATTCAHAAGATRSQSLTSRGKGPTACRVAMGHLHVGLAPNPRQALAGGALLTPRALTERGPASIRLRLGAAQGLTTGCRSCSWWRPRPQSRRQPGGDSAASCARLGNVSLRKAYVAGAPVFHVEHRWLFIDAGRMRFASRPRWHSPRPVGRPPALSGVQPPGSPRRCQWPWLACWRACGRLSPHWLVECRA